ncbi:sialic acid TRAP transporter substrate-binding protein SiaP [Marinomonas transparens]|uniref:Sialic acid TRAP transporter substrate-binding protein SiaP n=1 Tax=Marinomonas transparens TaxID=2795388 RepID=A0A934JUS4_9GAMM|nr:sialic acid TRAP transporter substrate-binding protein SiaP [Marinomonas transparens]MBJ7537432.1 sialic acid TRAP transporter substrate-binding protein SiaP [Marinomonas transparens]
MKIKRIVAAMACCATLAVPAFAADQIELKFTTASVPSDLHTKAMKVFKEALNTSVPGRFDIQLYDSGSLFKSGADLDALQRGNVEMSYLSYQLIADAIPKYGVLTSGYLFKNPAHYRAFLASKVGQKFRADVAAEMDVQILDACYLGTRELNLRKVRDVKTPADLKGIKLRMPGSDSWLFLGDALGASATPMPFGEVYLGLQTGAIDAQDNPLPTIEAAKFYEVTKQIVMTNHLVDAINIVVNNETWDKLNQDEKSAMRKAAITACNWNNTNRKSEEARLISVFQDAGLTVSTPDVDAFRQHVQAYYLNSDRSEDWAEGLLEEVNKLAQE